MKSFLNTILVYCACASLFYLQSCYDPNSNVECNDTETQTRNISADDLSKVPYTGFDTLYFLNKHGDTCIVRGTGKQYYNETELESMRAGCPPQRTVFGAYKISFISVKGGFDFYFILRKIYTSNDIYILGEKP
jgi:hypothetical protein